MKFSEFLTLCKEADELISELLSMSPKLHGKRPNTLKAATIHYLARKKGLNITVFDIFNIYGCYQQALCKTEKLIKNLTENNCKKEQR